MTANPLVAPAAALMFFLAAAPATERRIVQKTAAN
jgi:hypothetical protein